MFSAAEAIDSFDLKQRDNNVKLQEKEKVSEMKVETDKIQKRQTNRKYKRI